MDITIRFILFLSVFLLIYGALHYYFYKKLTAVITLGPCTRIAIGITLLVLLLCPILINYCATRANHTLITIMAFSGYEWMGFLFLFFSLHIFFDLYGIFYDKRRHKKNFHNRVAKPAASTSFIATLITVFLILVFGTFEAEDIRTERLVLKSEKLPSDKNYLRIVQISDTHFNAIRGQGLARKIIAIIRELEPDILVFTGDFCDKGVDNIKRISAMFRGLKVPMGKYSVTGNHEFYLGIDESIKMMESAGFKVLRNEITTAGAAADIVGVDDESESRFGLEHDNNVCDLLRRASKERFTILLKHRPRVDNRCTDLFDLQLSGHTHGGQIFPFDIISSIFFPYHNGLYSIGEASLIYVSRGTGTWGPPVRFLSPPEITAIDVQTRK